MIRRAICFVALAGAACSPPPQARDARTSYNAGQGLVAAGDFENGIDLLAKARANAGVDGEVRFQAAFALGQSYAAWAETEASEKPAIALERYQRSESWYRDAVRLRESSEDARANLAIVIRKRRALADQLGAGDKALEKRLDTALADQRAVRDELRQAEAAAVAGIDPAALATTVAALATRERQLSADVGVVSDLAGDERAEIEGTPEADRTPEQQGRLAQLAALSHYLERARGSMADARRSLRTERLERGHRRAEAAVSELVRAREQLLDPAAVLQALAADEMLLYRETRVVASLRSGEIKLEGGGAPTLPPHLASDRLSERQRFIHERASELSARLSAYAASEAAPNEPEQAAQLREVIAKAAPLLAAAVLDMNRAAEHLTGDAAGEAATSQEQALTNLARALEYFSGLRQLIELIHAEQTQASKLLDPTAGDSGLSTADRARRLEEIATLNRERLARMAMLLAGEKARELEQAKQQPAQGEEAADPAAAVEARYALAEQHRAGALREVEAMAAALRAGDALAPSQRAIAELDELRRLFFTLIEHLKDLHKRQGVTRDGTATAHGAADDERPALLPPLVAAETEHAALAEQIGEALAAQADAAAAAEAQGQGQGQGTMPGGPDSSKLGAAADEVRQATNRMQLAGQKLTEAAASAQTMSVDLEPTLTDQAKAIEHLAAAIELLSPPKQQEPQEQDQDQQKNEDQENEENEDDGSPQPQASPQEDLSQSDVDRRLRAIREREDERRRERARRPRGQTVEKDW